MSTATGCRLKNLQSGRETDKSPNIMPKHRIFAGTVLIIRNSGGLFCLCFGAENLRAFIGGKTPTGAERLAKFPFKLGLDLSAEARLVYRADLSQIKSGEVGDSLEALRDVIERRVNLLAWPNLLFNLKKAQLPAGWGVKKRLVVELPGLPM